MEPARRILEGTVDVPIRLARSLYARWRSLGPAERERLAPLAADARERALELRGVADRDRADRELRAANESLAAAMLESAAADPEVSHAELGRLREELRRELDRASTAPIAASPSHEGSREPDPSVRR